MFKNKTQMVIYIFLFIILIGFFVYLGKLNYSDNTPDNIKISKELTSLSKDNIFIYGNNVKVYQTLNNGTGIILCGFSSNEWTNYYAKYLNEVAKENNITNLIYYDFYSDRNNNVANYELILNLLDNYLTVNDLNKKDLYAPTLIVVKNGNILYFDSSLSFNVNIDAREYWNESNISAFKEKLNDVFNIYSGVS